MWALLPPGPYLPQVPYKVKLLEKFQALRSFVYVPSLPAPRRQRITKELRQSVYGRLFTRRDNRATQAGYTHDVDVCKAYNDNLEKVWTAISKYTSPDLEPPDNMALHNIVLIINAYLDHHALLSKKDEDAHIERKTDTTIQGNVYETINDMKQILENSIDVQSTDNIIAAILNNINTSKDRNNDKCIEFSNEKLKQSVEKEYQKYLDLSDCHRENSTDALEQRDISKKMNLADAKKFLSKWAGNPKTLYDCTLTKDTFLKTLSSIIEVYLDDLQCLNKV